MEYLDEFIQAFESLTVEEALRLVTQRFPGRVKLSSSLGQEDQVLTDLIARNQIPVRVFTIDTGRLFNEIYETLDRTTSRYKIPLEVFFPQSSAVESMVHQHGINLFYDSIANRHTCCGVRKVEPLNRALADADVWVTGLRADQTGLRKDAPVVEWLADKKIYKINPIIHWSYDDVTAYLREHNVPYNPMHDRGFISIGCAPCTRGTEPGEDPRAGRWWWEQSQKECGLHLVK